MAGQQSNYLKNKNKQNIFNSVAFLPSGTLAIVLCSNPPDANSTGANCHELPNAGGYVRIPIVSNSQNWSTLGATTSGTVFNGSGIYFAKATTVWGHISGVAIADTPIYGAGNIYYYGSFNISKYVDINEQCFIPVSGLSIDT